jgi:hypothetical protein
MSDSFTISHFPADLRELCSQIQLHPTVADFVLRVSSDPGFAETLNFAPLLCEPGLAPRAYERIAGICAEFDGKYASLLSDGHIAMPDDRLPRGIFQGKANEGLCMLTVYLHAALLSVPKYADAQIPPQIYIDTMKQFARFVGEHIASFGSIGYDRAFWSYRLTSLNLFRLGTLEFEIVVMPINDITTFNKRALSSLLAPNTRCISVHIPSDATLSADALVTSYRSAHDFFARYFASIDIKFYTCESWLLAPALKRILPAGSGILTFAQGFNIIASDPENDDFFEWVFKRRYDRYEDLPEDTSLMRGIKRVLQDDGVIGAATGILKKSVIDGY